jgi:hypothetical protein
MQARQAELDTLQSLGPLPTADRPAGQEYGELPHAMAPAQMAEGRNRPGVVRWSARFLPELKQPAREGITGWPLSFSISRSSSHPLSR